MPLVTKICLSKECRRAGEQLPLFSFGISRHRSDGHNGYCQDCARRQVQNSRTRLRARTKICLMKACPLNGAPQPLQNFAPDVNNRATWRDYCKTCAKLREVEFLLDAANRANEERLRTQQERAEAADSKTRVLKVLQALGPLQFDELARRSKLTEDQLCSVLAGNCGSEPGRPLFSRNGTGPRVYFLKPQRTVAPIESAKSPALSSFSTISCLHPVMRRGKQ